MAPGLGLYLDEVFFENYNINQAKQTLLHNAKAKPLSDTEIVTEDPAVCADSTPPNDIATEGKGEEEVVDNEPVSVTRLFQRSNNLIK